MTNLPARPDINQLRHQARDLQRAARSGDPAAAARIRTVADSMTLAAAQLAVARECGFASWPRLKAEVDARSSDLAEQVDAFLEASIRDWTGQAARILAATPQIAGYDFRTAVVLGDAGQVRQMLEHDQGRATRPDPRWGWTPLHAVCASRWHRLDPARADGLLAVAGQLKNKHPGDARSRQHVLHVNRDIGRRRQNLADGLRCHAQSPDHLARHTLVSPPARAPLHAATTRRPGH